MFQVPQSFIVNSGELQSAQRISSSSLWMQYKENR